MSKSISMNLGRTVKTNIVLYSTDNKGRDGYITYNDGGFWKDNIKQIKAKPDFPRHKYGTFHSLNHQAAPINYFSDGSGRDGYVVYFNGGLVKEFQPLAKKQYLSQYLRNNSLSNSRKKKQKVTLSSFERSNFLKSQQIQKNVVDRLYDQCIEKYAKKNNARPVSAKSALFKSKFLTPQNNYRISNKLITSPIKFRKKTSSKIINGNGQNCDDLYCKTSMNFYPKIDKKINNFEQLQNISSKKILATLSNKDNKESLFKSNYWNPILNTEVGNNLEIPLKARNFETNEQKTENTFAAKEEGNEKISQKKFEFNFRNRPKSHRRFHKVQIFNRYRPFLVDDFKDYSGYD